MATPSSNKRRPKVMKYSEVAMLTACKAVTEKKKGLREAARLYKVPTSTLRDRLRGRKAYHEVERTVITAQEEERLVEWIKESARRGFGRTVSHVQQAVQSILNDRDAVTVFKDNLPGKKWTSLFLGRHADVSLCSAHALRAQRAAESESKLMAWYKTAYKEIREAGGEVLDHPSRIFSCDETGFQLGGSKGGLTKVSAGKGTGRTKQVSTDSHTQITVLVCASASGDVHHPLIIEGLPGAHFGESHDGWIDAEVFITWLRTAFIPVTKHLKKPIVLFADRHRTHSTLTVSELCRDHGIILYQLPSHDSHRVQPLDLTTLKQVWREEVLKFQEKNCDTVGKKDFGGVFKKVWERGIKKDTVISGFRDAGLYPWKLDLVDVTKPGPSKLSVTNQIETVQAGDLTVADNVTIPLTLTTVETASTVPGKTATKASTTSANNTVATPSVTLSSSMDHEDLPIDPPSPTVYPSALPSLSPPSSSCHVTSVPVTAISSLSNNKGIRNLETGLAIDRLLDLAAKAGVNRLIHYRMLHDLGTATDDPEERLFCQLYSRLTEPDNDKVGLGRTKTTPMFDNLPLPSRCLSKPRKRLHTPTNRISSDVHRQHVTDMDEQKRKPEEEKEKKKKKEREVKKKRMEEQKEKKEQEKKKKEREQKKAEMKKK